MTNYKLQKTNDRTNQKVTIASIGYWRKTSGFTLIEILIVVVIIGILASAALLIYGNSRVSARDARRKADLATFKAALESYYAKNNKYMTAVTGTTAYYCSGAYATIYKLVTDGDIQSIPHDPLHTITKKDSNDTCPGAIPGQDELNSRGQSQYLYASGYWTANNGEPAGPCAYSTTHNSDWEQEFTNTSDSELTPLDTQSFYVFAQLENTNDNDALLLKESPFYKNIKAAVRVLWLNAGNCNGRANYWVFQK